MLSDPGELRPAKRQKTSANASPTSTHRKDATFWFEDGNIVLISNQGTEFRVHLGVLAFNAEFFRDMSGLAVPDEEERGYTTIEVADSTQDLTHFLHALYTRSYFHAGKPTPYDTLESLLRMSTKYLAQQLRSDLIKHLSMMYPPKMNDLHKYNHLRIPHSDSHSLRAIAMARENDVPVILPTAFYFTCVIAPSRLVRLHPRPAPDDLAKILAGREKITRAAYKCAWSWLFQKLTVDMCYDTRLCEERRLSVVQEIARKPRDVPFLFLDDMPREGEEERRGDSVSSNSDSEYEEERVCGPCLDAWTSSGKKNYKKVWNSLPSLFKLPKWEVLLKDSE
ncbi:hypothetical protein ARMGADRAFT_1010705 [Armillaria gallica]|uniref:BTB domain-containing protein n=1 Tax=Armillaria gallica TaxID=47427 RepID=A0A2H3DKP0_ARMGA|nr:hypothetical protein ARMGADRAFT_1010705 [Armillaria gallica]